MWPVLLPAAQGRRLHRQHPRHGDGRPAHHGRGLSAGDGTSLPPDVVGPVLHHLLLHPGRRPGHPHSLIPGLLRGPGVQQVPPRHLHLLSHQSPYW